MIAVAVIGTRLRIRRAQLNDADRSYAWFADPTVTQYLPLAGRADLPMDSILEYLNRVIGSDRPDLAVGIDLLTGESIGCGGFRNFSEGESAEVSLVIGETARWNQGYGAEAMGLLLQFAFTTLGLKSVWLVVRAENARAVRLFSRLGFKVVETLHGAVVIDGVALDKYRMAITRDEWTRVSGDR